MSEEKEIKERILKKAEEMFMQFGFARITMEEIASNLGVSKKTLYKYYTGKEQLLREMVSGIKCHTENYTDCLMRSDELDFIEKLKLLLDHIGKNAAKMRGPLVEELQRFHPEIWNDIVEFRRKGAYEKFSKLIREGVKKGSFRKDIDKEIIALVYLHAISGILNPDTLAGLPYTGDQTFESIVKIIMEGILTDEGRKKYISTKTSHLKQKFEEITNR